MGDPFFVLPEPIFRPELARLDHVDFRTHCLDDFHPVVHFEFDDIPHTPNASLSRPRCAVRATRCPGWAIFAALSGPKYSEFANQSRPSGFRIAYKNQSSSRFGDSAESPLESWRLEGLPSSKREAKSID
jgi:hypothetical protein